MQNLNIKQRDIMKVINNSREASRNLENYHKGTYRVNVKEINDKVCSIIGRRIDE